MGPRLRGDDVMRDFESVHGARLAFGTAIFGAIASGAIGCMNFGSGNDAVMSCDEYVSSEISAATGATFISPSRARSSWVRPG